MFDDYIIFTNKMLENACALFANVFTDDGVVCRREHNFCCIETSKFKYEFYIYKEMFDGIRIGVGPFENNYLTNRTSIYDAEKCCHVMATLCFDEFITSFDEILFKNADEAYNYLYNQFMEVVRSWS